MKVVFYLGIRESDVILEVNFTIDPGKPVALFDVDGVLVKPFVIRHFPEYLVARKMGEFDPLALDDMDQSFSDYRAGHSDYGSFAENWIKLYAKGIAGQHVDAIRNLSEKFWEERENDLLYPYTKSLIGLFKEHYTIIAVSGSTNDGLQPLCKVLGIDHIFSTQVRTNSDGRYIADNPINRANDAGKNEVVQEYLESNLTQAAWALSFGFGDNAQHDKPLLKNVGSPYLFSDMSNDAKRHDLLALLQDVPGTQVLSQSGDIEKIISIISERLSTIWGPKI